MQNIDKIKIVIAQDEKTNKSLNEYFSSQNNYEVVGVTSNGNDAIDYIVSKQPNIIVLDFMLQDRDGLSVLDYIKNKLKAEPKPKCIVLSNLSQEMFVQKALQLGANYFMLKPCSFDNLKNRIEDILFENNVVEINEKADNPSKSHSKIIEERISTIFITVGIPANIKGYQFLREAVKLTIEKPDMINNITKQLYPSIAERFETSASKVERAIRHAIEVAWNRGKIENINTLFGIKVYSSNEKPTNSEFIALIADKMLLEGA